MNSTIISTSSTVACVLLVSAKNSLNFLGCYNVITPLTYGYSSAICVAVYSLIFNN